MRYNKGTSFIRSLYDPFLTAYLARIGWNHTPDVSLETLRALHLHHNGAIPFENLDVVLPREIELSDEAIFQKLVVAPPRRLLF